MLHSSHFFFFPLPDIPVTQGSYFTTSLCYFPSQGLVNETLDHNETAAVMCWEMQEALFTMVLLLSNFKGSLEDLWNEPTQSVNQKLGLCSWAVLEKEICLSSVLSQAINPPKTYVQGIYRAATSSHVWPCSCQADTDPGFHPLSSAPPVGFSLAPLCTLALMEWEILQDRGSPMPTNFQRVRTGLLHLPKPQRLPNLSKNPTIQVTAINSLLPSVWQRRAHHSNALSGWDPLVCLQQSQHFPGEFHFTAVAQGQRLGAIMGFVACKALIWLLLPW